ncbi:hypothetical protein [Pseudomonas syringae]|uniref:hypothetical protein n=1 Tax=Pseudomonas syringae TaxID=317 RepID=UPI0032D97291
MTNKPNDVRVSRELLPCPYCGRAARYVAEDYVDNSGQPWPFAECDACNTGAPVEFWNKRAQPADQQGEPFGYWCEPHGLPLLGIFNKTVEPNSGSHCNVIALYRHAQPATANADDQAEFEAWFLANVESDEGLTLERSAARPEQYELDETAQIYRGWLARAKLNCGQS